MSNGVFSAGEADTAASRRIPAPSPAGSNTVDRNTPSPLYAKFAKSSPLPSPHTSDVQTGAETRPLLPAEPTAQHPVNSPQTKSLKSVGVDETKQETEIHLDRSHSRDPLYQPAPDYTAATKETAKTAEALPVVSSLANRIMSVPRPTPTVQTQTTVPDDMRNKPPAKPTGESLSRILPVATTAPLSFDYTRVPSTGKPDAGMHSPSSARSFRTADEHVADKSDDVVPAIPESARLHDAEEVFGSPRFSNDCPPTTSPKALDRLVGLPTTSPKAISTLTGVQLARRKANEAAPIPGVQGIQLALAKQSETEEMTNTARRVRESVVSVHSEFSNPSNRDGDDSDLDTTAHSNVEFVSHPSSTSSYAGAPLLPQKDKEVRNPASTQASPRASRRNDGGEDGRRSHRPSSASSAGSAYNVPPTFTLAPPVPSLPIVPSRILASGPQTIAAKRHAPLMQQVHSLTQHSPSRSRSGSATQNEGGPASLVSKSLAPVEYKKGSKAVSDTGSVASYVTARSGREENRKTLACVYMVAGLPKDPANWTFADPETEPAHVENAVPRFYRGELLNTMVAGGTEPVMDALDAESGSKAAKKRSVPPKTKSRSLKYAGGAMPSISEQPVLTKEESAKIQAKAIKLSLPRDVEVIAAPTAPTTTCHTFSFTIKAEDPASTSYGSNPLKGGIAASWDMSLAQVARSSIQRAEDVTYYGATLIVWTHADKTRTEAIRSAIESGSKSRTLAIAKAAKAAAAGRRFGKKITKTAQAPSGGSGAETEMDTEAFFSETDWEAGGAPLNVSTSALPFLQSSSFWLPYALTLVSKYPIYNLLVDTLKLSWARYHLQVARHSLTMRKLLEFPAPQPHEYFKVPVDPLVDAEGAFTLQMPGKVSIISGRPGINFQIWPLIRCLDANNILTISEIALAPFGRVIFVCRHLHMLNLAVQTFEYLLAPHGWAGIVHGIVHARDISVLTEDPGPFLMGVDARCLHLLHRISPEICVVDLETNSVRCEKLPPFALSAGGIRERNVKRLSATMGHGIQFGVPIEVVDAFPASRFRPFSNVEVNGQVAPAEQLLPPKGWDFSADSFLNSLDEILNVEPQSTGIRRLLRLKPQKRKKTGLDSNAVHIQQIVRNQSANFVDKRDLMETKMFRMNRRLALLMQESQSWNAQFSQFELFADKLNTESRDLRIKLDKQRKDAKRLTAAISESREQNDYLQGRLSKAEQGREEAAAELERIDEISKELQEQRDMMMAELRKLAAQVDDAEMVDEIANRVEEHKETMSLQDSGAGLRRLSAGFAGSRSASATPTSGSHRRTRTVSFPAKSLHPRDDSAVYFEEEEHESELNADKQRRIIVEAMKSIQERLHSALDSAQTRARVAHLDTKSATSLRRVPSDVGTPRLSQSNDHLKDRKPSVKPKSSLRKTHRPGSKEARSDRVPQPAVANEDSSN